MFSNELHLRLNCNALSKLHCTVIHPTAHNTSTYNRAKAEEGTESALCSVWLSYIALWCSNALHSGKQFSRRGRGRIVLQCTVYCIPVHPTRMHCALCSAMQCYSITVYYIPVCSAHLDALCTAQCNAVQAELVEEEGEWRTQQFSHSWPLRSQSPVSFDQNWSSRVIF